MREISLISAKTKRTTTNALRNMGRMDLVNLDPQAQPLDEFLNPIPSELNQFNSQDLRLIGSDHRVVNCNWKAVADVFP
ncbi:MAG: hypothetical protein CM15mP49_13680 [Actinomycetota bacterium]|nr:MAG: hypothetical protein CM15mP49_13680 [Actinomycetota bacterium]